MWLPAADRRGEIHFWCAKSLPYDKRLVVSFGLMIAGLATQIALLGGSRWPLGLPLTLAGAALLLVKGYRNAEPFAGPADAWRSARRAEVERIPELGRKQKAWDEDAIDVTSNTGRLALIGVVLLLVLVAAVVPLWEKEAGGAPLNAARFAAVLVANFLVMLAPFWFTGVRGILKNDQLVTRAKLLLAIEENFGRLGQEGEEFEFQLRTAPAGEGAERLPTDLKADVRFRNGPPAFLGLQMQVAINSVQGSDYPYFYCVLVAKPEFGAIRVGAPPRGVVVEPDDQGDVRVVVIRQQTTKNSGYHTGERTAQRIFEFALTEARQALRAT